MYWGQIAVASASATAAGGVVFTNEASVGTALAIAVVVYIGMRWLIAWAYRIRYWYRRGTQGIHVEQCPTCQARRYRVSGDWLLRCYTCGWKPGWPGVRWLTRSVPSIQLRRTIAGPQLLIIIVAAVLIVSGLTTGVTMASLSTVGNESTELNDSSPKAEASPTSSSVAGDTATESPTPARIEQGDADQDGLNNRAELRQETADGYQLSGADPRRKDIYLIVYHEAGTAGLSETERSNLREIWADMPVENSDGSQGISLHITQKAINTSLDASMTNSGIDKIRGEVYESRVADTPAACTAYVTVLVRQTGEQEYAGRGSAPGYLNIVARENTKRYDSQYSVRTTVLTHELLHNTVGEFQDGSLHTDEGWLRGDSDQHGSDFYLSDRTAKALSERGFQESPYYQQEIC